MGTAAPHPPAPGTNRSCGAAAARLPQGGDQTHRPDPQTLAPGHRSGQVGPRSPATLAAWADPLDEDVLGHLRQARLELDDLPRPARRPARQPLAAGRAPRQRVHHHVGRRPSHPPFPRPRRPLGRGLGRLQPGHRARATPAAGWAIVTRCSAAAAISRAIPACCSAACCRRARISPSCRAITASSASRLAVRKSTTPQRDTLSTASRLTIPSPSHLNAEHLPQDMPYWAVNEL